MKPILLVHAYALTRENGKDTLGAFMKCTLDHLIKVESKYEEIIHLGGWHDESCGPDYLLSDAAKVYLEENGFPLEKMKTMRDFDFSSVIPEGSVGYMPPRSTEEEIIMARVMFDLLSKERVVHVCFVDHFTSKALWYYQKLGFVIVGIEAVTVPQTAEQYAGCAGAILSKLLVLQEDPTFSTPEAVAHLESRTLAPGYWRPDPSGLFI